MNKYSFLGLLAIFLAGFFFMAASIGVIYGGLYLSKINPAFPGLIVFAISGVFTIYFLITFLKDYVLNFLHKLDCEG